MTNPANAIKLLITYAFCIPLAIFVGYLLTDPLDYGSMGVFGLIALLLLSPVFIKWHYPIMLFGMAAPVYCFFLKGDPSLWEVTAILSFLIAIIERAMNSERHFISPRVMVLPLLYTAVMVYMTAKLTGGIGLKTLGGGEDGGVGGGKKYIALFLGIALFFAITSRGVTRKQRNFYLMLYFLPGILQVFGDLGPSLPQPLNYIGLLIPPSGPAEEGYGFNAIVSRFAGLGGAASVAVAYMLARYGLRGILTTARPGRFVLFTMLFLLSLSGGFRTVLMTFLVIGFLMFFLEGMHRTKALPVAVMGGVICISLLIPFSSQLPQSFQRTLTIIPFLKLDSEVVADAEGSKQWRLDMWADLWPKVPGYLMLGKGYALTAEDYEFMGGGQFAYAGSLDKSATGLAVSGDYHSGSLSTLIPFGVWGAISIVWLFAAGLFICYRNFRYGDPELSAVNTFMLAGFIWHIFCFFFVFGAYSDDMFNISRTIGFSVALNWGVRAAKPRASAVRPAQVPQRRRMLAPQNQRQ